MAGFEVITEEAADEVLATGVTMFCRELGAEVPDIERIPKVGGEQRFFTIDMVESVLKQYCGESFERVFPGFIDLLVFDALVGSMDRHAENWAVVGKAVEPRHYQFSPIYDSARALLWNCDEQRLKRLGQLTYDGKVGTVRLEVDGPAFEGYMNRARPLIGVPGTRSQINHFELVAHLLEQPYAASVRSALLKVTPERVANRARIVQRFPFGRCFSALRRRLIRALLIARATKLQTILAEGGRHV